MREFAIYFDDDRPPDRWNRRSFTLEWHHWHFGDRAQCYFADPDAHIARLREAGCRVIIAPGRFRLDTPPLVAREQPPCTNGNDPVRSDRWQSRKTSEFSLPS